MTPSLTFLFGLVILGLFAWYFITDLPARKRNLGLVLTLLLVALCLEQVWPPGKSIRLGLDLKGGTSFLLRLIPQNDQPITRDMLGQAVEVIRKRVDKYGVSEPEIRPQGNDQIRVDIPGLDAEQIQTAKEQLQRVAKLEFALVWPNSEAAIEAAEKGEAILPVGYRVMPYKSTVNGKEVEQQLLVKQRPDLTGDRVKEAHAYFQQGYGVVLNLDSEGARMFDDMAAANRGKQLAIILDGEIQSAPVLQSDYYGGTATITGNFTEAEARNLASVLENPLKVPVSIEQSSSVSPKLGLDSIRSGLLAGLSGLGLVVLFVLLYYRFAGLIAIFGLIVNIILLFGMMAMFHFTLTLPGIAGIILTIGMAVDANVLIYERLREELALGKSLTAALNGAYEKAFSAIFDANVTTLITSVILLWQATGSVRGFAVTLTLGIIASMFSALICTRTAFRWMTEKGKLTKLSMMDLIPKKTINFLGMRKWSLVLSLILIFGSIGYFIHRGEANFGVDFRGGDYAVMTSSVPISDAEVREALARVGLQDATIQQSQEGAARTFTVQSSLGTGTEAVKALKETYPDRGITLIQEETVGAQIGREFANRALFALGLGLIGILIYTTFRFEFGFALGAVVAVLHDVIITLGAFSLIGGQLSLVMIGAVLTIAGYSINDTIVVFDRIREGLRTGEKGSVERIMNQSINETLGRTILTGGTTALSVGALYIFGGAVLRDFAFAILAGIVIGTYSSIFIASPIVLWWAKMRKFDFAQSLKIKSTI